MEREVVFKEGRIIRNSGGWTQTDSLEVKYYKTILSDVFRKGHSGELPSYTELALPSPSY